MWALEKLSFPHSKTPGIRDTHMTRTGFGCFPPHVCSKAEVHKVQEAPEPVEGQVSEDYVLPSGGSVGYRSK